MFIFEGKFVLTITNARDKSHAIKVALSLISDYGITKEVEMRLHRIRDRGGNVFEVTILLHDLQEVVINADNK